MYQSFNQTFLWQQLAVFMNALLKYIKEAIVKFQIFPFHPSRYKVNPIFCLVHRTLLFTFVWCVITHVFLQYEKSSLDKLKLN